MKASSDMNAVFTVAFVYHDAQRHVENATVKRTANGDWLLIGLETKKRPLGDTVSEDDAWTETGAVKSYKWEDVLACMVLDVYEYEGE